MFFNPPQQQSSFFGGGISPLQLQMMQQMQGQQPMPGGGMPPPQNPVNIPQGIPPGLMGPQGGGQGQMNPLASILGNQGGAMSAQGQMNQPNGMSGQQPGGGMDIQKLIQVMQMMHQKQQDQSDLGGNLSGGNNMPQLGSYWKDHSLGSAWKKSADPESVTVTPQKVGGDGGSFNWLQALLGGGLAGGLSGLFK